MANSGRLLDEPRPCVNRTWIVSLVRNRFSSGNASLDDEDEKGLRAKPRRRHGCEHWRRVGLRSLPYQEGNCSRGFTGSFEDGR